MMTLTLLVRWLWVVGSVSSPQLVQAPRSFHLRCRGALHSETARLAPTSTASAELVVRLAAISVVCRVAHTCQLRYLLQQRFFDAAFKGHIDRTAPLASPTKTKHRKLIIGHFYQGDLTAVGRQRRINFVV